VYVLGNTLALLKGTYLDASEHVLKRGRGVGGHVAVRPRHDARDAPARPESDYDQPT
jgi:hypothetical protein